MHCAKDRLNRIDPGLFEERFSALLADPRRHAVNTEMDALAINVQGGGRPLHLSLAMHAFHRNISPGNPATIHIEFMKSIASTFLQSYPTGPAGSFHRAKGTWPTMSSPGVDRRRSENFATFLCASRPRQ